MFHLHFLQIESDDSERRFLSTSGDFPDQITVNGAEYCVIYVCGARDFNYRPITNGTVNCTGKLDTMQVNKLVNIFF